MNQHAVGADTFAANGRADVAAPEPATEPGTTSDEQNVGGDTEAFVTVADVSSSVDSSPTPTTDRDPDQDELATSKRNPSDIGSASNAAEEPSVTVGETVVSDEPRFSIESATMDEPPTGDDDTATEAADPVGGSDEIHPEVAASTVVPDDHSARATQTDGDDYADYLQSVEAAAARSRAELQRQVNRHPQAQAIASSADATTMAYPSAGDVVDGDDQSIRRPVRPGSSGRGGGPRGPRGRGAGYARQPDPRPRWKRPKTWFISLGVIIALAVIAGLVYTIYLALAVSGAYEEARQPREERGGWIINEQGTPVPISPEEVEQRLPNWERDEPVNIALMGIDYRDGDTEPPRSDTLIIVRVDPATKQVSMMSLPRDLWVYIPEVDRWDKINAAFPVGEFIEEGYGPGVVAQTVEYNFGIDIHYYMTIDFDGFRTIIDRLGGIVIDVRAPIKDDQYPTEGFGLTREYFPTGFQKMDGETALRFARTRHGDNDVARGERQQQVLMAVRSKATGLDLIWDVRTIRDIVDDVGSSVRTDLEFNQMIALANLGRTIDPANIRRVNLWEEGVLFEHQSDGFEDPFYFDADWDRVYELVQEYFPPHDPAPVAGATSTASTTSTRTAGTEQNSTDVPNLAVPIIIQDTSTDATAGATVSTILSDVGFENISNETSPDIIATTVIYDYAEQPATARYIAEQLGLDESAIVYGYGGNGIVVAAGDDFAGR